MAHSDDQGLVLPPKLAPIQVAIVPIYRNPDQLNAVSVVANEIKQKLENLGISVKYDDRDTYKPGWKFSEYEFKGVPVRLAIGPRDLENKTVEVARRDTLEKEILHIEDIEIKINNLLDQIQKKLYHKALSFREDNTHYADSWKEFKDIIENKGGFVMAHWDGTSETEEKIKEETKATIRTIPIDNKYEDGKCIYTGNPSKQRVVFAKAY